MPARERCGCGQRVTSRPSSTTVPSEAASSPASRLTSVDLPAPFGPISACTDAGSTASETRSTAIRPAKWRLTLFAASSGSLGIEDRRDASLRCARDPDETVRHRRDADDDHDAERELPVLRERAEQRFGLCKLLEQR